MGADAEEYYSMGYIERPGKKPSLHSRLQNGMLPKEEWATFWAWKRPLQKHVFL